MTAWIGVASSDHVAHGRRGGFMQVCHGKKGPLARIQTGDRVFYYSPSTAMGGGERLQRFTAAGTVKPGEPYLFDMGGGFMPYRRDVEWLEAAPAPIALLLDRLDLTRGKRNWGYVFRFGIVAISNSDADVIVDAMSLPAGGQRAAE